ncbi:MAG: tetratricopeptide repeat protein [Myxococcota bacterium]
MLAGYRYKLGDEQGALQLTREAAGLLPVGDEGRLQPNAQAKASALSLLGAIHEAAGRIGRARDLYERALESDGFRVQALLGAGRTALAERRWHDARTRFDTVVQSADELTGSLPESDDPPVLQAELGGAKALMQLERVQDAHATLLRLHQESPEHAEVLLWLGHASLQLGEASAAEDRYRELVRQTPDSFDGYLALSQMYFGQDRIDEAGAIVDEARAHVEQTSVVLRQLGEAELRRGRIEEGIGELRRALQLDRHDKAAQFSLGVALRRAGQLAEASQVLTALADRHPEYPGLQLEQGRIFEERGDAPSAVSSYLRALEDHPDDIDLRLRLGAAQVLAEMYDDAEETLTQVMQQRANSAEAEHYLGRVEFERGKYAVSLRHFTRSTTLDPMRGQYHLYVARASLSLNNLGRALESIATSIERDPMLGDAYWVRGKIRLRTGQVQDAITDLEKALELNPSRIEAYASMAECFDQLGQRRKAAEYLERAVEGDTTRGQWWYKLGRLERDSGRSEEATEALLRATSIGSESSPTPPWLADAYRLLGEAHKRTEPAIAIEHYRRYLELAPPTALDRRDVENQLRLLSGR